MVAAERYRQQICPDLDKGHAWIPSDTKEGQDYWAALEIVRAWTKANHALLHQDVADMHLRCLPFCTGERHGTDTFWVRACTSPECVLGLRTNRASPS